jgi:glutaconate CoA-transferase subunit A
MNIKQSTLSEAIFSLVNDGDRVVMGAGLEHNIPFAATYEIIRQGKRDLDIIAPISDATTDMLIGAGCVGAVTGAWVGNVSGGLGHNHRRAVEHDDPRSIRLNDHSNFSLGMALMAAAYGMPYVPIRSLLGSDIVRSNANFKRAENPFQAGEPVILVPPEKPDVAILPVQRADALGNAHHWGSTGLMQEAALAADRVIVLADEIVPSDVILSDPSRILFPAFRVSAVCETPAGGHPSPMIGRWRRDNEFFADYHRRSRDRDGFLDWLREWVLDIPDHEAYRGKLGGRLETLRIKGSALAVPTNYAAE